MDAQLHAARAAADPHVLRRWRRWLIALLRLPTYHGAPVAAFDAATQLLARAVLACGARRVEAASYGAAPHLFAEWEQLPGRPTVLLYAHYDVQPPGVGWRSPPFAPIIRGERLYARGAADDKGPLIALLAAIECWQRAGGLPVNLRLWIDGNEERGGPDLEALFAERGAWLAADGALICDTQGVSGRPSLTYGLRGSLVCEVEIARPGGDLHAGRYGGGVPNPLEALSGALAGLFTPAGRGIWGGDAERAAAIGAAPALIITGMSGGSVGRGARSSIPTRAEARLTARLVPPQRPDEIARALRSHFRQYTPPGLRLRLAYDGAVPPLLLPPRSIPMRAADCAARRVWGAPPALVRSGGTIGPAALLWNELGVPLALLGFGQPADAAHAADESLHLPTWERMIQTVVWYLAFSGETSSQ